jgi:hypothetical protein
MSPKIRKFLILAHLWAAGFMAPAFGLHAISGGLYLMDIKGSAVSEDVALPAGTTLDFKSPTLETDVRELFTRANIDEDFDYIRNRGTLIETRPTSRSYIEIKQTSDGFSARRVKPDAVKAMIELHKGHGPALFKTYQKIVALMLLLVIFGGVLVGFAAAAYRRQTVIAVVLGTAVFIFVAFLA